MCRENESQWRFRCCSRNLEKRKRGRPRKDWLQEGKDLSSAGIKRWKEETKDRKSSILIHSKKNGSRKLKRTVQIHKGCLPHYIVQYFIFEFKIKEYCKKKKLQILMSSRFMRNKLLCLQARCRPFSLLSGITYSWLVFIHRRLNQMIALCLTSFFF